MAQFRQSGNFINGVIRNGAAASDHHHHQQQQVSIAIRSSTSHKHHQQSRPHHHRRLKSGQRKISITVLIIFLLIAFISAVIAFLYLSSHNKENSNNHTLDDELENDTDFLTNVTRIKRPKVLKFGHGSIILGKDSRYWDKDDRRRDEDYNEEDSEKVQENTTDNNHIPIKVNINSKISRKNSGLYNEVGRDELKRYEAEYVASLMSIGQSKDHKSNPNDEDMQNMDVDDEYDDGIDGGESSSSSSGTNMQNNEETDESFVDKVDVKHESLLNVESGKISSSNKRIGSRKKSKRHSGSCEMKILNSSALLIEPLESRKFTRFTLQYTQTEEKPSQNENQQWYPKFAGHQTLQEREQSFIAHDQTLNCGFIKGPNNYPSTGLDLLEDDAKYISTCHIAVSSCIFGNSDRLRPPAGKTFSKLSKKNVCFVMFMDEITLQTLNSEGQIMDRMGFIGLWKIIVVKNLPYSDMRRVGKIPKFLSHRLFPSARYSIWLDSKLRLQLDPFLILEYFLWRKGYEYAISNHYDRHCVWEEVIQNKKLNKYNHTIIDQQFLFYQADGLTKYNPLDPNKMLPSNVPEGSIIVRAHTPMSNLFSCLWFNEVERFTPRDQLSFAYTYYKFTKMNPEKPFYLNMFKDCERRKIAKLYHHRAQDKRNIVQHDIE